MIRTTTGPLPSLVLRQTYLLIISKYGEFFDTRCNQFGFKKKHSTDMAVFALKEVINYYNSMSSPVYACMLDSSKAFDRVNHYHLFDKLLKRGMPKLLVRLLFYWYKSQTFSVVCNNVMSSPFTVSNGVRQGGVLSPILFNIFIDDLSDILCATKLGCYLNDTCFNHICYADDAVLLAPSPEALQLLINKCQDFACNNDMIYNVKKSVIMAFRSPVLGNLPLPVLYLGETILSWVSQHKYLGVFICCDMKDDEDINRQIKSVYARGNILVKHFKHCSIRVKIELFRTYLLNLYSCQLWCNYSVALYKRLKVAFNNILRALLHVVRGASISQVYVSNNITDFNSLVRKNVYGFLQRIQNCCNVLIKTVLSSVYFIYGSNLLKKWCSVLYIHVPS